LDELDELGTKSPLRVLEPELVWLGHEQ